MQKFEAALAAHLKVDHVATVDNATLGLIAALRTVVPEGSEIVTTPFSFVATANAIRLSGCIPVFADIDPVTTNLDPAAAEAAITDRTGGIVPVHAFGIPCDTAAFRTLADSRSLPLIYDAAHAFGVRHDGRSLLAAGDASVVSFHATKVFHSFEGGAVICRDAALKQRIQVFGNHGIEADESVSMAGFNCKMSELHAAVGLVQLEDVDQEISTREPIAARYQRALSTMPGITPIAPETIGLHNFFAYPILVEPDFPIDRDALYARFKAMGVTTKRYFHPLLSDLAIYRDLPSARPENLPVARSVAERVL